MAHTETKYKCTQCGAEDLDRGTYGTGPMALVCWNCGAGTKMQVPQQTQAGVGMLPLNHPYWLTNGTD